ncbi:MAG: 3',5'-cyclic-nucleotide phosphodiesterase [Desulfuromonadaceae bacterium]|nr:3',5'-cyclic-nucleotide phosphodiesterase [Desulfuromonadaceae bacterium]
MKLRVLGCSGGIGGAMRTTSFLLDSDVLIDAGTGVGDLSLAELAAIEHIFVTHSHLDHIACIPLLLDSVGVTRSHPLNLYATGETLEILRQHIFNWKIWPDFSEIPTALHPVMRYQPISVGETINLNGRSITAIPAHHTVPAVGYHLDSGRGSLVFSGDTTTNDAVWPVINSIENLRYLVMETAFSNSDKNVAILSRHLCPSLLGDELAKCHREAKLFISHLKPGEAEQIMQEIENLAGISPPTMLVNNQIFDF